MTDPLSVFDPRSVSCPVCRGEMHIRAGATSGVDVNGEAWVTVLCSAHGFFGWNRRLNQLVPVRPIDTSGP